MDVKTLGKPSKDTLKKAADAKEAARERLWELIFKLCNGHTPCTD